MSIDRVPLAVWVSVPLVAAALFGALGPLIARRLAPRRATWLLSVGSLLMAASTAVVLMLVVLSAAGTVPAVAGLGHWSWQRVEAGQHFGEGMAAVALVALAAQSVSAVHTGWQRGQGLVAAWIACRSSPAQLVVLPDARPAAFAVPGWPGRIVTTRGLLENFCPAERRAVLAHEQAHLDGHHDLHVTGAVLAAAVNPLLRAVPGALRLATERWADEAAASAIGDRALVAATIGRAALEPERLGPRSSQAMGVAGSDVEARVAALLRCPAARRPLLEAILAVLALTAIGASMLAAHDIGEMLQAAIVHVHPPAVAGIP